MHSVKPSWLEAKGDSDVLVWETQWVLPPVERDRGVCARHDAVGRGGKPEQAVTAILLTERR